MRIPSILLPAFLVLFLACNNDRDDPQPGILEQTGILGTWEINSQEINGITDMSVNCCDFIEFTDDDVHDDYTGKYRNYGSGVESSGVFMIDPVNGLLSTGEPGDLTGYIYQIRNEYLILTYSDNGADFVLTYIKRE